MRSTCVCRALLETVAIAIALSLTSPVLGQKHPNEERGFSSGQAYDFEEIDTVNLFNGNLSLQIPLGPSYPVGGGLSYNLRLIYNSKVWDYEQIDGETNADPNSRSNAGLGWQVTLGQLVAPGHPSSESDHYVYRGPDGSEHVFYDSLHPGYSSGTSVLYTHDSSYLRLKLNTPVPGQHEIEFPSGEIHRFAGDKLTQIRDRFNNTITVSYPTATQWKITDTHLRTHLVNFTPRTYGGGPQVNMVSEVKLMAFGDGLTSPTATYTFNYGPISVEVDRGCQHSYDDPGDPSDPTKVQVALLNSVSLDPNSSVPNDDVTFAMTYYTTGSQEPPPSGQPSCRQGALSSLRLPTLGQMDYAYHIWTLPAGCGFLGASTQSPGIKTRTIKDAAGTPLGTWTYASTHTPYSGPAPCIPSDPGLMAETKKTTVVTPLLDQEMHYFSSWAGTNDSPQGFTKREYGLPIDRAQPVGSGTSAKYLSTEIWEWDELLQTLGKKRSTYLRYDSEAFFLGCPGGVSTCGDWNRRVVGQRVVYHDDGNIYAETTYSNFDGLGHYRTATTGGTFALGNVRTTTVNYNVGAGLGGGSLLNSGTLNVDANGNVSGNFSLPSSGTAWILDTWDTKDETEGVTAREEACFQTSGFLARRRTLKNGTARNARDLVAVYTHTGGNLTSEQYYGGDLTSQALGTGALCGLGLPTNDNYRLDHSYSAGVLATSEYKNHLGNSLLFKSVDQTIDPATGLVAASKDISGAITTAFEYDKLGRLLWTKPPNNHGSWVERVYSKATSSAALANVNIKYRPNGLPASTPLAEEKLHFDAFGRPSVEEKLPATGTLFVSRVTLYDAMGHVTSKSEWGSTSKKTEYKKYDAFGRPTQMKLADNHVIVLGYTGDRVRRRFLQVGTARDPVTGAITETQFWTRERYDRQGRLHQLAESSGAGNVELNTNYTYDIGNRLKSVSTCPVATAPCPSGLAQTRNFTYDNRGFLTSETHPEKGPSGNGPVTYADYDALGHALRCVDGGFDLKFAYDRAERLFEVKETGGAQRVMKSFTYGDHLPVGTPSNGKIEIATRRNYPLIGGSPFEVIVTETYTYAGKGGRVSQRSTLIDDHGLNQFAYTQSWVYDDLGNPTSLGYPQCTSVPPPADNGCFSQGGALPRTITSTYSRGWLTSIPGYLSSITYHNNLQMNVLTHTNGVTVTYAKDPNQMQRPASVATSAGWSTGTYAYDGSGNIVRIGPLLSGSWYLYDGVSRMVQSSTRTGLAGGGGTATQNVSFDPFGNIQSITNDGVVRSTPTSGSTNRLTGAVVYDAAGSLTSWNGNVYEYGPFGEMSAYRSGTESWLYLYTVDEERVRAYDLARSIGYFSIRDLDGRLLREYRSNSWTTPKDYVYRSDGRLVSSIEGPTLRHLHVDHLGSVRQITNSSGASVEYHVYYPFGEEATATGTEQMKFTGHERDLANPAGTADDLDYMHARFSNPQLGRFLGVDTLPARRRAPQSWNRYSLVEGSPLTYVDPDGLGKVGAVVDITRSVWRVLKRGLNRQELVAAQKEGEDIVAGSRSMARDIATEAGGGRPPIHEVPKQAGHRPHYHPADRSGGHVFYGIAAGLTLSHYAEGQGQFAEILAYMGDILNPLALGQDMIDLYEFFSPGSGLVAGVQVTASGSSDYMDPSDVFIYRLDASGLHTGTFTSVYDLFLSGAVCIDYVCM